VETIKKIKKYTKCSKRDGKYTKFKILASSTVSRLHKKIGSKNPKKKLLPRALAEALGKEKYFAESLTAGSR
jgi:predicted enzyme involved in methoxymalonyl-ACP biosynthesis